MRRWLSWGSTVVRSLWHLRRRGRPPRPRQARVVPAGRVEHPRVMVSVEGAGVLVGREGGRRRSWRIVPRSNAPALAHLVVGHGNIIARLCPRDLGCNRILVEPAEGEGPRLLFNAESDFLPSLLVD